MLPSLQPGDILSVEGKAAGGVNSGDIVVLTDNYQWLVHRVLRLYQDHSCWKILTKGDNRLTPDPVWVSPEAVGKVIMIQRGERWIRFDRRSARFANRMIAFYSNLQIGCASSPMNLKQRFIYKITSLAINGSSKIFFRAGKSGAH